MKKHIDPNKKAAKLSQAERLKTILEIGSEEDFVAMVKAANPGITPEKLLSLIEQYREVRRRSALGA